VDQIQKDPKFSPVSSLIRPKIKDQRFRIGFRRRRGGEEEKTDNTIITTRNKKVSLGCPLGRTDSEDVLLIETR